MGRVLSLLVKGVVNQINIAMEIRLVFLLIACYLDSLKAENGVMQHDTCDNGRVSHENI